MKQICLLGLCAMLSSQPAEGSVEELLNIRIIPTYQEICESREPYSANPELYVLRDDSPRTLQFIGNLVSDIRERISGEFEIDRYGIDLDLGTDDRGEYEFGIGIFYRL